MWTLIFALIGILLFFAIAIGGSFFVIVYWRYIQRPVPKHDGEFMLSGLDGSVEVLRDKHGIPNIYAETRADLFRAQGYVHAQDRLWQMEQNRRIARGTLAEVFGEAALDADRFSRIVGFWRAAEAELESLDPEERLALEQYAEGVNAYIDSRPKNLAAEFNLLRIVPDPWTPLDSLGYGKVMAWSLSVNWDSELVRLRLMGQLGPMKAAELEPDYPEQNVIILEALGEQFERLLSTAGLLQNQYEEMQSWLSEQGTQGFGVGQGSNSWALGPKATETARPLLANDPHLAISMPSPWYENHLICPDLHASGVSLTGLPAVLIGHNEEVAWGITNSFADVQDLYVERTHPDDETMFEFEGEWEQAKVFDEEIYVRKQPEPYVQRVVVTRHGPLVSDWLNRTKSVDPKSIGAKSTGAQSSTEILTVPLALQWTAHRPGHNLLAGLRLNTATDWDSFNAALSNWSCPPQNFTYADASGHIGYVLAGDIPRRENNPGLVPACGWRGTQEWTEMVPFDELPRILNPESNKIVTANNKMVGDDYPHFLGNDFYPGWRASRIEEMLSTKMRYNATDMVEIQMDTGSKLAVGLTPWFVQARTRDLYAETALVELRNWNHRMDSDSVGALIYHFLLLQGIEMAFGSKLEDMASGFSGTEQNNPIFGANGFVGKAETKLYDLLNNHPESHWYTDTESGKERNREEFLQALFDMTITRMRKELGESLRLWQWGRHHQIRYVHPMGSVRLLKSFFNKGPYPVGGDFTTPLQTRHAAELPLGLVKVIPSYRQIYEVGNWDKARTVNSTGQSGHPLSTQYNDQIEMWREGEYHVMPWSREAVEREVVNKMTLHS